MFFGLQPAEFRSVELGTRVKQVTPDVAFVEMELAGDGVRNADGTPQPRRRGQLMLVLHREEGRWTVASYRYLDIHDAPLRR